MKTGEKTGAIYNCIKIQPFSGQLILKYSWFGSDSDIRQASYPPPFDHIAEILVKLLHDKGSDFLEVWARYFQEIDPCMQVLKIQTNFVIIIRKVFY